ncbi:MAG: hypothetical protein BIFFINMI_00880 [Phycisphaerae bacterium]|nr:hypothetical protein [Phycisphaerae bacterium]
MSERYDVVVIGGGPGGATAATLLADAGRRVLVLEKGGFPRFHIGESLMPETYHVFKRLGMLPKLAATDFPRKESVQFVSASGRESQPFYFHDRDPNEWSITWQVPRDRFDQMLLSNAAEHGATVRQGVRVCEVLFQGDQAVGVRVQEDDRTRDIAATVVVDATGLNALLGRQLGLRQLNTRLRKACIFAHYRGGHRDSGRDEGATLILSLPDRAGWFWYIPLPEDTVSVGVVADPAYLVNGRGDDPAATLDEEISRCPGVARRLAQAARKQKVWVTADYSFSSRRTAGNGWVLAGDAFGFLDPIYSSGVLLALVSGRMAADAIDEGLGRGDVSAGQLGKYHGELAAGIDRMRKLVYAFYDPQLSFGKFLMAHPHMKDHLTRLLIGDLFSPDVDEIFPPLAEMCPSLAAIETAPADASAGVGRP